MISHYCNTDLELRSGNDLTGLAAQLAERCDLLSCMRRGEEWQVLAEAAGSSVVTAPDHDPRRHISALLTVLEALDAEHRASLAACTLIEFNIGWTSADARPEGAFALPPELLSRMAALGATLAVTIYPSSENDSESWS